MRLPNNKNAVIDSEKITGYALSRDHAVGKHKARVFESVLGMSDKDSFLLVNSILEAVQCHECIEGEVDSFGARYVVDFTLTNNGRSAPIRTSWIVRAGEGFPRLTSVYIRTKLLPL